MEGPLGWISLLGAATFRISVPYVFAALGGCFSERSGVVNIALEGLLLHGAFACIGVTYACQKMGLAGPTAAWLGIGAAIVAGVATGALHAWISVRLRGDQIVSGLAINLLALGLTQFLLVVFFGSAANSPRVIGLGTWDLPILSAWEVSRVLFCTPLVLLALVAVFATQTLARRTVLGLRLHAVGEHPQASRAAGIDVRRLRTIAVLLSGGLAALGGAYLALDQHQFTAGMSNGRGFIALAAVILGRWTPRGAALACLLFGGAEALQIHLQARGGSGIPTQFMQMLPYVVTMVALGGAFGRTRPPAALGRAFLE